MIKNKQKIFHRLKLDKWKNIKNILKSYLFINGESIKYQYIIKDILVHITFFSSIKCLLIWVQ